VVLQINTITHLYERGVDYVITGTPFAPHLR